MNTRRTPLAVFSLMATVLALTLGPAICQTPPPGMTKGSDPFSETKDMDIDKLATVKPSPTLYFTTGQSYSLGSVITAGVTASNQIPAAELAEPHLRMAARRTAEVDCLILARSSRLTGEEAERARSLAKDAYEQRLVAISYLTR